jgi:catechol 2,3-dioxygenase-like lactoylglutathione lyase family enzyme
MKKTKFLQACIGVSMTALSLGFLFQSVQHATASPTTKNETNKPVTALTYTVPTVQAKGIRLGAFSISLNVKDINISKAFYENLGFKLFAGDIKKNYYIMKNENSLIGLFQGMFKNNILTFNPGWDVNAAKLKSFDDVREIQKHLKDKGVKLDKEADEKTIGPAGIFITDPDGNSILIDQHI